MKHTYEEYMQRQILRREMGLQMLTIRTEAKVSLTSLARELGISVPYLIDMEWGQRTYQEKYIDTVIDYCAEEVKKNKRLIKNQQIKS